MSINETIRAAVLPLVPICVPDTYDGEEAEYCVFNYSEYPVILAEGKPDGILYYVMLHWYLPKGQNPILMKRKLRQALLNAGFTYPTTTNASDDTGQHYVFECQYVDGDV